MEKNLISPVNSLLIIIHQSEKDTQFNCFSPPHPESVDLNTLGITDYSVEKFMTV